MFLEMGIFLIMYAVCQDCAGANLPMKPAFFDFEIQLDSEDNGEDRPISCGFRGERKQFLVKEPITNSGDFFENLFIRWNDDKIDFCQVSHSFSNMSLLLKTTVGQINGMRWVNLLFSRALHGIAKTESIITIENSYDDPDTYGSFIGETTVNISFVRQ